MKYVKHATPRDRSFARTKLDDFICTGCISDCPTRRPGWPMDDPENQKSLRCLCRAYPRVRLILAHIARSFCYRNARHGLHALEDLDNVTVDTSGIGEADSFRAALNIFGPRRVLWGSDFPVSELRGRCVTTGNLFFWLHPELLKPDYQPLTASDMTLVGIESLVALHKACDDAAMTRGDIEDVSRAIA